MKHIPTALAPLTLSLLTCLPLASCLVVVGDFSGFHGDSSGLEHHHTQTIALDAAGSESIEIASSFGDITCQATSDAGSIEVTLWEEVHGDAHATLENGRLQAHSASGRAVAIGEVRVHSPRDFSAVDLSTGAGDITWMGPSVTRSLALSSGAGDLHVEGAGCPPQVEASTGSGDIGLEAFSVGTLLASTGAGSVSLEGIEAHSAEISSGAGDIELSESVLESLEAVTGLGDIDCSTSSFTRGDLSTGLGDVQRPH